MLSIISTKESLFPEAGYSVFSSVSLIKIDCTFHKIKHLTTLDNNSSTESILEQCIGTVHLFMCETHRVQFL